MRKLLFLMLFFSISITGKEPKITILTSVFKGNKFIHDFLTQIAKQTIFDQSELLMIDANSPEDEHTTIFKFMKNYPNIIYVRLAEDPGIYGVWNYGIHLSRGKYLTNANLDDRYDIKRLEEQANVLDNDYSVDAVYSDMYRTNIANDLFENAQKKNNREITPIVEKPFELIHYWGNAPMWRKLFHNKYGLFDEFYFSASDFDMCLRGLIMGAHYKKIDGVHSYFYDGNSGLSTATDSYHFTETPLVRFIHKKYIETKNISISPGLKKRPIKSYVITIKNDTKNLQSQLKEACSLLDPTTCEIICIDTSCSKNMNHIVFEYMNIFKNIVYIRLPKNFNLNYSEEYGNHAARGQLL